MHRAHGAVDCVVMILSGACTGNNGKHLNLFSPRGSMVIFQPQYATVAQVFQNEAFDVFTLTNGPNYFKVFAAPTNIWGFGPLSGVYIGVPNSGSLFTVFLTQDQTRQMANALSLHVVTGSINKTVNGVTIATTAGGVNITVNSISYTTFLTTAQAQQLANAMSLASVTND